MVIDVTPAPEVLGWTEILGRFHPMLVHVPIGLVLGLALIELFGFGVVSGRYLALRRTAFVACALAAGVTAASGWFLAESGGYDAEILGWHRWLSVALAALLGLVALADLLGSGESGGFWRRAALLLCMGLVVVTGHQGGSLTHGPNHLTRDAPDWLRAAVEVITPQAYGGRGAGAGDARARGEEDGPGGEGGEDGAGVPPAEPVAPSDAQRVLGILERRCVRCHGPEKSKAGLRLDQPEGLASVVDPGAASDSELFRRVSLPTGHGDEMPPDGPPLEEEELASLRRWINAGAQAPPPASRPADAPQAADGARD